MMRADTPTITDNELRMLGMQTNNGIMNSITITIAVSKVTLIGMIHDWIVDINESVHIIIMGWSTWSTERSREK